MSATDKAALAAKLLAAFEEERPDHCVRCGEVTTNHLEHGIDRCAALWED